MIFAVLFGGLWGDSLGLDLDVGGELHVADGHVRHALQTRSERVVDHAFKLFADREAFGPVF